MTGTLDRDGIRRRLATGRGRAWWRSLDELAQSPEFLAYLDEEFPAAAQVAAATMDRRRFLQIMAASLALAGLSGCGPEPEPRELVPYVEQPPGIVPGRARTYATATTLDGYATGVLLSHQMGRPIKVEGNPDHPASLGATSAIDQATILGLYDPSRSQTVTAKGQVESWERLVTVLIERRRQLQARHGEGLRLLTGTITSPTLAAQIAALQQDFPAMRWHRWTPLNRDNVRAAARQAFGRPVDIILDVAKADVILAIDGDFLLHAPGHLRYAREFASRRRPAEVGGHMSRLYAIESTPTLVGAKADHRLALRPDEIAAAVRHLAAAMGAGPAEWVRASSPHADWLSAVAADLREHHGRALVHAGREQPAATQVLIHAINHALGGIGETALAIEPVEATPVDEGHSLAELVADMAVGQVSTLVMLDVNPAYTAPADLGFADALARVELSLHLGAYTDETAQRSLWHVPMTHEYEAWGDARAFDGTVTIQQPQVRPLYNGRSAHTLLAVLQGETRPDDDTFLLRRWRQAARERGEADFETFWHDALRGGVVPDSAARRVDVGIANDLAQSLPQSPSWASPGLTLLFRGDAGVWDGRFAPNGWLLELPRPFTRLTWDNAAMVAPETARRLEVKTGEVIEIRANGRALRAPVWILPGQAPDCVTLPLGFGRTAAGPVGSDVGFDAYRLRLASTPWEASGGEIRKIGETVRLASTQGHQTVAGRDLVRDGTLADFLEDPKFLEKPVADESLYPGYRYDGAAWAMSINLNSCIGCTACVVACQAENNIPVVGKDAVLDGREMHWLRIDRYYSGGPDMPKVAFEPVPCMHCENAPCEVVCPVQATVHDSYGLNLMVYNRCVGTRFCSNNCPYKVRRFNFFGFAYEDPRPRPSWNPGVSIRGRGVMEKCTYCVQRIRTAQIDADRENRPIRDGEVVTACQQACPTGAIIFGDKNDKESAVAKRKASPLDYAMLDELNTRPRTTYEAEIRNLNPALGEG